MKRNHGKTFQLIKLAAATGDCIVCHSRVEVERIKKIAEEYGFQVEAISYDDFLNKSVRGKSKNGFMIDNVEMFLEKVSPYHISAISLNP